MTYRIVIPARHDSSRLPGKPLLDLAGLPMVERVRRRCLSAMAQDVWVATDDARIHDEVARHGGKVLMTRNDHASGTDRLQEVAVRLGLADDDVIVNVQGDEPLIPPTVIDQVAHNLLSHPDFGVATLCEPILSRSDLFNPNIVKTVFDAQGRALYFSRAPIAWHREAFAHPPTDDDALPAGQWWRHIGIYAYRVSLLNRFVSWPPAPLEQAESLEQLRAMHHGVPVHVAPACEEVPGGVDTPEDLAHMRALLAGRP